MNQSSEVKQNIIIKTLKPFFPSSFKDKVKKVCDHCVLFNGQVKKVYDHYFNRKRPPVGKVNFGDLRRLKPFDEDFGWKDGQVIDRYYIENFLERYKQDVRGRVLEMGENKYTKRFGADKVTTSDVLNYVPGNPQATIVADLTKADNIPSNTFDCIVITQTLQMIYDIRPAIKNLHRILKPGGVVLATSHGTSKIGRFLGVDSWGTYWHFTRQSSKILFEEFFKPENVEVKAHGNILTATAFLYALVVEDLKKEEMDYDDPRYEVIITVRAVKENIKS